MAPSDQPGFNFEAGAAQKDGYSAWQQQRQSARRRLAGQSGLPLGHVVEIQLYDGVVLKGRLRLKEELLFFDNLERDDFELTVERATFRKSEIESCVRLD